MYCVYKHTSPSGKTYIGLTRQKPEKRWQNGLGYRTQEYFYRAIQKYGWNNFKHEVVAINLTAEQADVLEKKLIVENKSNDKNFGYNIESGGNFNKGRSEYTAKKLKAVYDTEEYKLRIKEVNIRRWSQPGAREHMSKLLSGERNPMYGTKLSKEHLNKMIEASRNTARKSYTGENNNFYGKKHTEEAKRKISESRMGAKNCRARKVMCVETGITYGSIRDAYRETGVSFSSISKCCLGVTHRAGGYHWQYVEEVFDK